MVNLQQYLWISEQQKARANQWAENYTVGLQMAWEASPRRDKCVGQGPKLVMELWATGKDCEHHSFFNFFKS